MFAIVEYVQILAWPSQWHVADLANRIDLLSTEKRMLLKRALCVLLHIVSIKLLADEYLSTFMAASSQFAS